MPDSLAENESINFSVQHSRAPTRERRPPDRFTYNREQSSGGECCIMVSNSICRRAVICFIALPLLYVCIV